MELLLILTYVAICVGIFKLFRIPLNKWTVPTAFLGGVVLIGAILVLMNYNHPYSEISRSHFPTVPIVPEVTGQVIEVNARPNQIIEQGEPLLKLDPVPFEADVETLEASLLAAETDLERAKDLFASQSIAKRDLDLAQEQVDELTPQLEEARWMLENTVVRAPSRGFATQVTVRPGVMAAKLPLKPVMVFVPLEQRVFVAWFRQNSVLRLRPGNEAEVLFDGIPGKVFSAKIKQLLPAMAEGQLPASGALISGTTLTNIMPGRVGVELEVTDPDFEPYEELMPLGTFGQAAVYSHHAHHLAMIRKILLRMSSWLSYIYPMH